MKHRRVTVILAGLTLLVLVLSLPGSLRAAYDRGGFYVFSRAFFEDIPKRLTGPGRFRFILQPVTAIVLGIRNGLADARAGRPPYLYGVLMHRRLRRELMQSGFETVVNLLLMGILVDAVPVAYPRRLVSRRGARGGAGTDRGALYARACALESLRVLAQARLTGGTMPYHPAAGGERLSEELEHYGTSPLSFVVPDQYACLADGVEPRPAPAGHAG